VALATLLGTLLPDAAAQVAPRAEPPSTPPPRAEPQGTPPPRAELPGTPAPATLVRDYVDLDLVYERGRVRLSGYQRGRLVRPARLVREAGRFKVEVLLDGRTVERVDFEFPLLAGTSSDLGAGARRALELIEKNVTSSTRVRVPLPPGFDEPAKAGSPAVSRVGQKLGPLWRGALRLHALAGLPLVIEAGALVPRPARAPR
jgi:hypothetical protein